MLNITKDQYCGIVKFKCVAEKFVAFKARGLLHFAEDIGDTLSVNFKRSKQYEGVCFH